MMYTYRLVWNVLDIFKTPNINTSLKEAICFTIYTTLTELHLKLIKKTRFLHVYYAKCVLCMAW